MTPKTIDIMGWMNKRQKEDFYAFDEKNDFIDDKLIETQLKQNKNPDPSIVKDIIDKALSIETLTPEETASLLSVKDESMLQCMREAALKIKKKVYDNRIVTFAPLYLSNECVNNCLYCGFRRDNVSVKRKTLNSEEIKKEIKVLAGDIGHKRLIAVYGEHPSNGIEYIKSTLKDIYSVKVKTKNGYGQIRRVNVNAPPFSVDELKELAKSGIGTY